jgi:hypothetical protein
MSSLRLLSAVLYPVVVLRNLISAVSILIHHPFVKSKSRIQIKALNIAISIKNFRFVVGIYLVLCVAVTRR